MTKHLVTASLALAIGAALPLSASAQAKPEVLVKQRQAGMTLMGKYFGPLGGMAQGRVPFDAKLAARNAEYLVVLSQLPWDGFDPSTAGEKTRALPEIYTDSGKFRQASDELQGAIAKLAQVAKTGDEAATKQAIGAVGRSCGTCHDNFRQKQ